MWRLYCRKFRRAPTAGRLVARRTQYLPSSSHVPSRSFHCSPITRRVIPYVLADIGEGITECQIISWSVSPGDKVQQFDSICEVQSDKASVEITSRFDGTIKALHYDQSDMAVVGKPLLDIDVDDAALDETDPPSPPDHEIQEHLEQAQVNALNSTHQTSHPQEPTETAYPDIPIEKTSSVSNLEVLSNKTALVTPAVRHMLKSHSINVTNVQGTGKDGRVLKEDVQRYISGLSSAVPATNGAVLSDRDQLVPLSPIEHQMFNVMTRSLNIPHFLYTHTVDLTSVSNLRQKLNGARLRLSFFPEPYESSPRLSPLPFVMKALSLAFLQFPKLNSHLDLQTDTKKPHLLIKSSHNFGIAVDTPQGLLVPVIKDVQNHSIVSLAAEINRISELAKGGKLSPSDLKGATFIISNIGSIGGSVVGPVIVEPMVGILGVGQARAVPTFKTDENGVEMVTRREEAVLSWSADHRILDGATVARCAKALQELLENFELVSSTLK